jgi:hypothetical protein
LGFGPEVLLALSTILLIALLTQTQYAIKDLAVGPSGISAHLDQIEKRQSSIESEIIALQLAVSGLVTKYEKIHLDGLANPEPYMVSFSKIMVERELDHLDAMHYLVPLKPSGLNAIVLEHQHDGYSRFDLKEYVQLTSEGRQYLSMRADLDARTANARLKHE